MITNGMNYQTAMRRIEYELVKVRDGSRKVKLKWRSQKNTMRDLPMVMR